MNREIERKFLVKNIPQDLEQYEQAEIIQGYIVAKDDVEVRLRKKAEKYFMTVKSDGTLVRVEKEIEINENQYRELWSTVEDRIVEKIRYDVQLGDLIAELDIYKGKLNGLRTVEVEFVSEDISENFKPPEWFGEEITENKRYKNKNLATCGIPLI